MVEDANLVFEDDLPEFTQDELLATPTDEPEIVAGEGDAQPEAGPGAGPDAPRDRGRHYPLPPHFGSIRDWSDDDEDEPVTPAGAPDADEPGVHVAAPARSSADQRGKAPVDAGSSRQPPASAPPRRRSRSAAADEEEANPGAKKPRVAIVKKKRVAPKVAG